MAAYGWALAFTGFVDVGYLQGLTSFSEGLVGPSSCCGYPGVLVQPLLPKAMNTRWIELCSVSTSLRVLVCFYQDFCLGCIYSCASGEPALWDSFNLS